MIVIVISLAVVFLIAWGVYGISLLAEQGAPPKDVDVMEFLDKNEPEYSGMYTNWDDCYYISGGGWKDDPVPDIFKTQAGILFPYYIKNVGVIPVWYKSAKRIDALFTKLYKGSKYENKKRKKLGLD
jgi:hypothetical protein